MSAPCQTTPTRRRLARWPFSCKWPRWYLAGPCIGVGCRPGGGVSDHGLRNLLALCESQGEVVGLRDHCCGLCWSNLMQNLGQPMRRRAHPCASQRTHCYKFERPSAAERLRPCGVRRATDQGRGAQSPRACPAPRTRPATREVALGTNSKTATPAGAGRNPPRRRRRRVPPTEGGAPAKYIPPQRRGWSFGRVSMARPSEHSTCGDARRATTRSCATAPLHRARRWGGGVERPGHTPLAISTR